MEKIVEKKICKQCNISFDITDQDLKFYDKISPSFDGKKISIPTPLLCPDCRQQRRMVFRNERFLYHRECDATGKKIVSIYSPDKKYKVFDNKYWWGDKWDTINYGKKYDFEKSFFKQLKELQYQVPRMDNNLADIDNVLYSNQCWHAKDLYLCFNTGYSESCMYTEETYHSKNIIDSLCVNNSEYCYSSFLIDKCFKVFFSENCENSSNVYFSIDCKGCNNVFLSSNLRNKSFCILNVEYSKNEYLKKLNELLKDISKLKKEFAKIKNNSIFKLNNNISTQNSIGDYLSEVENSENCFNLFKSKDCKYVYHGDGGQNSCYDMNYIAEVEKSYEGTMVAGYKNLFCFLVIYGSNNFYCDLCADCNNCFGCIGLNKKQYCILNKQYTKEEYNKLVPKIIEHMTSLGEWGEFFPSYISPFGYNETVAQEYYPLKNEEIRKQGYNCSDFKTPFSKVEKIIPANKLPENIEEIPDDILNRAIECEITKKPFRIIKKELEFYRKHNLPIPKRHPDQRHLDRMKLRNPRKLFDRNCDKCNIEIKTTFSPDRDEIVYCEKCYNKKVY